MAAVPFPGAPEVFRSVSCSWLPFLGSAPIWLRLAGLLLQWTFIVGLAVSWYTTWFSTLCQRSFPFRCFPLAGSATFLAPVRWSTPAVEPCCWVGGVLLHHLVFYLVPAQLPLQLLTLSAGVCNLFSQRATSHDSVGMEGHITSDVNGFFPVEKNRFFSGKKTPR